MGKHSKRKASYLPKVAAGAAPFALLLAGPATAASAAEITQPDLTLPLDLLPLEHEHHGSLTRDVGTTADHGGSAVHGSADLVRHDVYRKELAGAGLVSDVQQAVHDRTEAHESAVSLAGTSDAESVAQSQNHRLTLPMGITAQTGNNHRLSTSDKREKDVALAPAVHVLNRDERVVGAAEGDHHSIWLPHGIDVLSENSEQADAGTRHSGVLDTTADTGRFAGSLAGGLSVHRSSGEAVDLGENAAFGTASEQRTLTQFDDEAPISGQLTGFLTSEYEQTHAFGGHVGPVSGLLSTGQTADLGHHTSPLHDDGTLTDSISGDLGIDHVAHVHDGVTTSFRGTLPGTMPATAGQDDTLTFSILDQPPSKAGVSVAAPPLSVRPH